MKKILFFISIFVYLGISFPLSVFASEKDYFIVTAYYSPLPNQKYYLKGNYADEIRLNGRGIAGASGKKVFSGMLAAPKNYKFGTKIHLEGLGIGSVEDRGGAIVNAGKRGYKNDRIDVWMGYGDEGLRRSLYWGKRKIKGSKYSVSSEVNFDYKKIPAPYWVTKILKKRVNKHIVSTPENSKKDIISQEVKSIFHTAVKTPSQIKLLQNILTELNMYNGDINGKYHSIEDIILSYQKDNNIIFDNNMVGAGYFGPKTRKMLYQDYIEYIKFNKKLSELTEKLKKIKNISYNQATIKINKLGKLSFGNISHEVRDLQLLLKNFGYFDTKDTAIFGSQTKQALIDMQIDRKIIKNKKSIGAGIFGPKTKEELIKLLSENYLEQELIKLNLDEDMISALKKISVI